VAVIGFVAAYIINDEGLSEATVAIGIAAATALPLAAFGYGLVAWNGRVAWVAPDSRLDRHAAWHGAARELFVPALAAHARCLADAPELARACDYFAGSNRSLNP
jgi:hypothetical protein